MAQHYAEYRTKDGRTGCIYFESKAKTWHGLCRTAKTRIWQESIFKLGTTIMPEDIAFVLVNGNAE